MEIFPKDIQRIIYHYWLNDCLTELLSLFTYIDSQCIVSSKCYQIERRYDTPEYIYIMKKHVSKPFRHHRDFCSCFTTQQLMYENCPRSITIIDG